MSATERQQYGTCEVDYLESMSDNGLVSISVSKIWKYNSNYWLKPLYVSHLSQMSSKIQFKIYNNIDINLVLISKSKE